MRKYATILITLLVVSLPSPAFPWGWIAHLQGGAALTVGLPNEIDLNVFIRANVGPDLASTPIFSATDRNYIHTPEFAECLFQVASLNPQYPHGLATAYGWGAHLAFDEVAHSLFVPEDPMLHTLVEVAVDTSIYYRGSPSGWKPLPRYHVGWDCCNPWLISEASLLYRENYDPQADLVKPWMVMNALATLNIEIGIEYNYIQAKGGPEISEWFLNDLVSKDILPGYWEDYYSLSLDAAQEWIDLHSSMAGYDRAPITTPIPATLLLLGSGLAGLGLLRLRRG